MSHKYHSMHSEYTRSWLGEAAETGCKRASPSVICDLDNNVPELMLCTRKQRCIDNMCHFPLGLDILILYRLVSYRSLRDPVFLHLVSPVFRDPLQQDSFNIQSYQSSPIRVVRLMASAFSDRSHLQTQMVHLDNLIRTISCCWLFCRSFPQNV